MMKGRTVVSYLDVEEVEKVTKNQNMPFLGIHTSVPKLCYSLILQKVKLQFYLFIVIYLFVCSLHQHPQRRMNIKNLGRNGRTNIVFIHKMCYGYQINSVYGHIKLPT